MAGVFIFYVIYLQIENAFLTPRIMRTSVNLMGLSVLIALLAGTELAGVVGALVAVPSAALVAVHHGRVRRPEGRRRQREGGRCRRHCNLLAAKLLLFVP